MPPPIFMPPSISVTVRFWACAGLGGHGTEQGGSMRGPQQREGGRPAGTPASQAGRQAGSTSHLHVVVPVVPQLRQHGAGPRLQRPRVAGGAAGPQPDEACNRWGGFRVRVFRCGPRQAGHGTALVEPSTSGTPARNPSQPHRSARSRQFLPSISCRRLQERGGRRVEVSEGRGDGDAPTGTRCRCHCPPCRVHPSRPRSPQKTPAQRSAHIR